MITDSIPMDQLSIERYWDLSTCHITKKDDELLKESPTATLDPLIVHFYGEGCWLFVPLDLELYETRSAIIEYGYSLALLDILLYAMIFGVTFIRLDCDATIVESLTKFEW